MNKVSERTSFRSHFARFNCPLMNTNDMNFNEITPLIIRTSLFSKENRPARTS